MSGYATIPYKSKRRLVNKLILIYSYVLTCQNFLYKEHFEELNNNINEPRCNDKPEVETELPTCKLLLRLLCICIELILTKPDYMSMSMSMTQKLEEQWH